MPSPSMPSSSRQFSASSSSSTDVNPVASAAPPALPDSLGDAAAGVDLAETSVSSSSTNYATDAGSSERPRSPTERPGSSSSDRPGGSPGAERMASIMESDRAPLGSSSASDCSADGEGAVAAPQLPSGEGGAAPVGYSKGEQQYLPAALEATDAQVGSVAPGAPEEHGRRPSASASDVAFAIDQALAVASTSETPPTAAVADAAEAAEQAAAAVLERGGTAEAAAEAAAGAAVVAAKAAGCSDKEVAAAAAVAAAGTAAAAAKAAGCSDKE
eukprot:1482574-Prymnesium_polylepis.1